MEAGGGAGRERWSQEKENWSHGLGDWDDGFFEDGEEDDLDLEDEPNVNFLTGHFPDRPIMPGVLQVEALAQLAGIVCLQMEGAEPGAVFFFAGVDGVKWKKPVVPGDSLVMEVEIKKWNKRFGIATATGRAYVDGEMAVELDEMKFALAK